MTKDKLYLKILRMFEDMKCVPYSIHQIALTGASEGKQVGEWFGPNTVAQVLKYDEFKLYLRTFYSKLDATIYIYCTLQKVSSS